MKKHIFGIIMREQKSTIGYFIFAVISLIVCITAIVMAIIGIKNNETYPRYKILNYTYAYQTSEVQEYTHDIYLAHCQNDVYIEVPEDYSNSSIRLKKTNKMIYYYVYGVDFKVSNKGWEVK